MKKFFFPFLILCLSACHKSKNTLTVATSSGYPPFEYRVNGQLQGFDIDLANFIAKELEKKVIFQDMSFDAIISSVKTGRADMAIATMAITPQRQKECEFSIPYYFEKMAMVFKKNIPIQTKSEIAGKKIACQQGTTMAHWLKKNMPSCQLQIFNMPAQLIEALKANHVQGVLMDETQAKTFCKQNPELHYAVIAQSPYGYGVALPKGSPLLLHINIILKKDKVKELKKKWGL